MHISHISVAYLELMEMSRGENKVSAILSSSMVLCKCLMQSFSSALPLRGNYQELRIYFPIDMLRMLFNMFP